MKKLLLILAVLMMFTACAKDNVTQETLTESASDSDVLKELCGTYYTEKYLETFKETKSVTDAWKYVGAMIISEDAEGYTVMASDGHQGSEGMLFESAETDDSGKITIAAKNELGEYCNLTYVPASDGVKVEVDSNHTLWNKIKEEENPFVMEKIDDITTFEKNMTEYLFEGFSGIDFKDDGIYAEINGVNYKMEVLADIAEFGGLLSLKDGGIYLTAPDGEDIQAFYSYEEGKITLTDFEEKILTVFEK